MKTSLVLLVLGLVLDHCLSQTALSEWNADNYPNPQTDHIACGRYEKSLLCDPNSLLTTKEADTLEWMLNGINNYTKCPCSSYKCETKKNGYVIGIAVVKKLAIPNGDNANDNEKLAALRDFTFNLEHKKWRLGDCDEDIIIAYDADMQGVYTFTGDTARERLSQQTIDAITSDRKHYFRGNKHIYAGLRSMILDYREALNDGGFVFAQQVDQTPKGSGSQVLSAVTSIVMLLVCTLLLK